MRLLRLSILLPVRLSFCLGCFLLLSAHGSAQDNDKVSEFSVPSPDYGADTLVLRKAAQLATEKQFKVFYGFHFTDELKASGITFRYQAVTDELQSWNLRTTITAARWQSPM
jgi:hypothetical protein